MSEHEERLERLRRFMAGENDVASREDLNWFMDHREVVVLRPLDDDAP